jgi:predicted membrane channel-forming protein YqfA (hemolysin III family)
MFYSRKVRIHRIGMFVLMAFLGLVTLFDLLHLFSPPAP